MNEPPFPVAEIKQEPVPWYRRVSRMWILTAVCLAIAVALTIYSYDSPGTRITVRFPDGHGLKLGDSLRHRGIEVGHVSSIELSESLDAVNVHLELVPSADAIACEGSKFWIVRPRFDLTGVSGLETAVGAKYVAVLPGNTTFRKRAFNGLGMQPADAGQTEGVEITLRGEERFGVNPAAPLLWRGVEVGTVLGSSLSPDASSVDTRVRIDRRYRRLLSRDSKFWVTSGIDIGFDMGGLEVSTDSLATIARGGISFITPGNTSRADAVQPGDVFTLHERQDPDWLTDSRGVNLLERKLPPISEVDATWQEKRFGFTREKVVRASAVAMADGGALYVLLPSDLADAPAAANEGTFSLLFVGESGNGPLVPEQQTRVGIGIARLPLAGISLAKSELLQPDRVRIPVSPEDCFAVRHGWSSDDASAVVIEMIGRDELRVEEDAWVADDSNLSREIWHGALIVSSNDECAIGMLVFVDDHPTIVPFSPLHVAP